MMEMNKNSWTLSMGLSSFLTTVCTQLMSFASTIWLMMFDRTKFLSIQQLTTISWFTSLKQVQMCILTGMPMFSGYFTLTSCTLASNLQITQHKIWSSYGFAGLARYPAIMLAWRLGDFPRSDLCLRKTIKHFAFLSHLLSFEDVI